MSLAVDLYPLVFDAEGCEFVKKYNSKSQFELALTEGKNTNRNERLVDIRKISFEGKEIDITPHLKSPGEQSKALRVHFSIQRNLKPEKGVAKGDVGVKRNLLVIGHCGKHLEVSSTRSMK